MITFSEIVSLYGTPISSLPPQIITKKVSTAQVICIIIIVGVAAYGIHKISTSNETRETGKP